MGRLLRAKAGTGMAIVPGPSAPSTWTRTCHEPESISQMDPEKNCGSPAADWRSSGGGGYLEPSPLIYRGVTRTLRGPGVSVRISICATPGIIGGVRIVATRW